MESARAVQKIAQQQREHIIDSGVVRAVRGQYIDVVLDGTRKQIKDVLLAKSVLTIQEGWWVIICRTPHHRQWVALVALESTTTGASPATANLPAPGSVTATGKPYLVVCSWDGSFQDVATYEVQHNSSASESGATTLKVEGSNYLYWCSSGTARHFRVRAVASSYERSAWSAWANATATAGNEDEFLALDANGDPEWVAFDWDDVAAVGGADMVHNHNSALEGGVELWPDRIGVGTASIPAMDGVIGLAETAGTPPAAVDEGRIYVKDDGGDTELYYEDGQGREVQLTENGAAAGGGAGGGWPYSEVVTVDHNDPNADFATLAAAIAGAAAGSVIEIGPDVGVPYDYTAGDIPNQLTIRGASRPGHDGGASANIVHANLGTTARVTLSAPVRFQNLEIDGRLDVQAGFVVFEDCIIRAAGANDFITTAAWGPDNGRIIFRNCEFVSQGGICDLANAFGAIEFYDCHCNLSGASTIDHDAEILIVSNFNWDSNVTFVGAGTRTNLGKPIAHAGTDAGKGTPVFDGELYYATDTNIIYLGDAGAWTIPSDLKITNSSGGAVVAGNVGYIDEAGEFKTTATAYLDAAWAVVTVGGANNADIYVKRRKLVTIVLNGNCSAGDFLYTSTTAGQAQPLSYVRPEVFAVARTANAGGAGGTCEALLLCHRAVNPASNTNDVLRIDNSSDSDWTSTLNGAPVGAVVTYNVALGAGSEDCIVPVAAGQLGKLILWNIDKTPDEAAYIESVNVGANTITVTAAADVVGWLDTENIQVRSTTAATGGAWTELDVEITSTVISPLAVALLLDATVNDAGNATMFTHPYEADATSSRQGQTTVGGGNNRRTMYQKLINRRFCYMVAASGVATAITILRLLGVEVAEP